LSGLCSLPVCLCVIRGHFVHSGRKERLSLATVVTRWRPQKSGGSYGSSMDGAEQMADDFWVYSAPNGACTVHRATCAHCRASFPVRIAASRAIAAAMQERHGLAASHVTVRRAGGPFNRDWWLIPLILVDTAPPALPGSARVMEPSRAMDAFHRLSQLSMKNARR
jgi:hypothetical protein